MEALISALAGTVAPWAAAVNGLTELPTWAKFAVFTFAMIVQAWAAFHKIKNKDKPDGTEN